MISTPSRFLMPTVRTALSRPSSTRSASSRSTTALSSTSTGRFLGSSNMLLLRRAKSTMAAPMMNMTSASADEAFPSLVIGAATGGADAIRAAGSFAEATASFLDPDPQAVESLAQALKKTDTGIVAHYYMDVELQGVLTAANEQLAAQNPNVPPAVGIADSLKMGDMAVEMVKHGGAKNIICLGVDFMAESVRAILSKNGYGDIPVYRADARKIGCSLAESAEQDSYRAWLQKEGADSSDPALHVVYINTSLETKAVSNSVVPTITCTSSNVMQTILQATAQMGPNLKILYGPDTYMGNNLQRLLEIVSSQWDDERIARDLHPAHSRASLQHLANEQLKVFPSGNCVVHHMFGEAVVDKVRREYVPDDVKEDDDAPCYVTAHLEVPGEMFEIAMTQSLDDRGAVGSTSDILNFIKRKVNAAAQEAKNTKKRLRFILGTEAGMVTSIVQSVQQILRDSPDASGLEAEIIFPVAQEAVTATADGDLPLVPGVSGGEGCSTAGGCATCPFMKMNDLDAVMDVLDMIDQKDVKLPQHLPPDRLRGKSLDGRPAVDLGSEPIVYMRHFMLNQALPDDLCNRVMQGGQQS